MAPKCAFALSVGHSGFPPPSQVGVHPLGLRRRKVGRLVKCIGIPAWTAPNWVPWKSEVYFTRVRVLDNRSLPQADVRREFDPMISVKVEREFVEEAVASLCEWYRLNGYLFSAIVVDTWPTKQSPLLVLRCIESILSGIKVIPVTNDGLELNNGTVAVTRPAIITRAMRIKVGKPFRWHSSAFQGLMQLGVFTKAWVEVEVETQDRIVLKVLVVEEPRGRFEPGFGMNQLGQVHGDISLLDRNFMGRAQTLRMEWQKRLDMTRAAGGIEFFDPRVGAQVPISFSARAFRRSDSARQLPSEDRPRGEGNSNEVRIGPIRSMFSQEHDSDRDGISADVTYRFANDQAALTMGPIFERIHWREWVDGVIRSRNIDQIAFKSTLSHNTLSPPMAPREGHRFHVDHIVGNAEAGQGAFHKVVVALSQHMPITRFTTLKLSSVFGLGTENIPPHEMTVLGGLSSVRGYMYGELGRSASWRTTRLELLIPFAREETEMKPATPPVREVGKDGKRGKVIEPGTPALSPSLEPKSFIPPAILDRLPNLSAYAFADSATRGAFDSCISGSSVGVGLRVAGLVNVELARAAHGRDPRLSVSLVDHRIHY